MGNMYSIPTCGGRKDLRRLLSPPTSLSPSSPPEDWLCLNKE